MSFILDALKKSESDRQRQSGPSLFEVKVAPPRRALPLWAVAIAVLLGINIIVVSWMLLRRPATQQPAPSGNASAAAAPPAAANSGPAGSGARAAAPTAPVAPPPTPAAARAATAATPAGAPAGTSAGTSAGTPGAASAAASADSGQPRGAASSASLTSSADQGSDEQAPAEAAGEDSSDYAPAVQPAAGSGGSGDDLPLYQQIASSAGLPELHLDLHVFADRPQDRFVMINMHRLGEGDSLPNGVQVAAIRPDGVVLSYHGRRFLLPRN